MGPQILVMAIFPEQLTPFMFGFGRKNCFENLKLDYSGLIGRPHMSKTAHIMGQKYMSLIFFIKLTPFQFGFCARNF